LGLARGRRKGGGVELKKKRRAGRGEVRQEAKGKIKKGRS
jgi:hypothetical protein